MFDLIYEQTYTMKWKYLAALLDMFNPQIGQLPDDNVVDEMIDAEYIIYDRDKKEFHLPSQYRMLIDSFLNTNTAVNIEAPKVKMMKSSLSLYYLQNRRHMLVLIQIDEKNEEDGLVEVAISSKKSSTMKLFESVGLDLGVSSLAKESETFDPDHLPNEYQECYEKALANNRLFRVTLCDLDSALTYISYAKSEIQSKFSGESFAAYVDVLDSLYESIRTTKNQLSNLYR